MSPARTIARLWRDAVVRYADAPAYLVRSAESWSPVSWRDAGERADALAHGFLAHGINKGDRVALLARTTLEWALIDFALAQIGAVSAPVYATSADADVHHVLDHSGTVVIVCEDADQAAKVERIRDRLPELREIIVFADLPALESEGRDFRLSNPTALDEAVDAVAEDDLYTLIYTSGTTGRSKGCMISHRNYHEMAESTAGIEQFEIGTPGETLLLFLPLAHNFGRLMLLLGPTRGVTVALEPEPRRVAQALVEVSPTLFPSVPRVYEKIHGTIAAAFAEATGVKRRLIDWALAVGSEVSRARAAGTPLPPLLRLRRTIASRLVFGKVHARMGGRLRVPISGGAPLAAEIGLFFDALGIPVYEGYGLTECTSAATVNRPGATRYGTVGTAIPGFELALADDGELLLRSPTVFAGYYRDPAATAAVLREDGWLMTGDVATIDDDGFVTITDRKKDLIVTAGGKNVAPQNLENDLKLNRWVSQVLVVGDRRPYLVALVTLDPTEMAGWAAAHGVDDDLAALAADPRVVAVVQEAIDSVNAVRAPYERIKRFAILADDFTMEREELTPTLKLRRRVCIERYGAEIEALYART
jgi:long-chain acyl-CoA synthetase